MHEVFGFEFQNLFECLELFYLSHGNDVLKNVLKTETREHVRLYDCKAWLHHFFIMN